MPNILTLRVIGDLDEGPIDEFQFYSGENRVLVLQLFNSENDQKITIPATATKTLTLSATPDNLIINDVDITLNNDDASIFSVQISEAMSVLMITGTIQFQYVVGTIVRIATLPFGLKRLDTIME